LIYKGAGATIFFLLSPTRGDDASLRRFPLPDEPHMLRGTNLVYTKQYNLRIVHEVIRVFGPLSRADIARRTELTVQTVSNLVKELLECGLIYEAERRQEGRGAPSTALALNPDGAFAIGLDLDSDHLTGVLMDLTGSVRQRLHLQLATPPAAEAVELMVEMADTLISRQGLTRASIRGAGVGVPGPMHQEEEGGGYLVSPKAFVGWHDVPLAALLEERLQMPVILENNATAAAMGERWYGEGRQIKTFFYIYFGSGLGGGLILNGQPFEGCSGNAGEVGYFPMALAGEPKGSDENLHVGLHFNLRHLYELLRGQGAEVHAPGDLDRLLSDGHPGLLAWMDAAAEYLTGTVLAVEYLIDPEAIFYGGRLPDSVLQGLMDRVGGRLPARRIHGKVTAPRQLLATAGADAAALGVATLPIYEFFAPAPEVLLKVGKSNLSVPLNTRLAGIAG
jgi:predicted NBD/HSP70 family sugar kinase